MDPQEVRGFQLYLKEDLAASDDSDEDDYENEISFMKQADARYEAKVEKAKIEFPYRSTMHVLHQLLSDVFSTDAELLCALTED